MTPILCEVIATPNNQLDNPFLYINNLFKLYTFTLCTGMMASTAALVNHVATLLMAAGRVCPKIYLYGL